MPSTTAILIHGCHTGAKNWTDIIWGSPQGWGRVATALLLAHQLGGRVQLFMGTGASTLNGKPEAQAIRDYALEQLPTSSLPVPLKAAAHLLANAILKTKCATTAEELKAAMAECQQRSYTTLWLVSTPQHIVRCYNEALKLNPAGYGLQVLPYPSATGFTGYSQTDVLTIEPPHRGDDPQLNLPVRWQRHTLAARLFRAGAIRPRNFAIELDKLLRKFES